MILSDRDILRRIKKGDLKIKPFDKKALQPSTIDFQLDSKICVFDNWQTAFIDLAKKQDVSRVIDIGKKGSFIIHPGEFILGSTVEKVTLPTDLAAKVEGRSSLGRVGLVIHATAGYVDPGFSGHLTLEISNISRLPIKLYAGMRIGQMSFIMMSSPVLKPYGSPSLGSKYQGQEYPTATRIWKEFKTKTRKGRSAI